MDCTNFEDYRRYHRYPEIDIRREIIRSVQATTAFLAVLSIAAIILVTTTSQETGDATTESLSASTSSVLRSSWAGIIAMVDRYYACLDVDIFGYLASVLVLATFSMKSMRPLRITAIASNIAFLIYAHSIHLQPIFILHSILLPLNIFRLAQIELERGRQQRRGIVILTGDGHIPGSGRDWRQEAAAQPSPPPSVSRRGY